MKTSLFHIRKVKTFSKILSVS